MPADEADVPAEDTEFKDMVQELPEPINYFVASRVHGVIFVQPCGSKSRCALSTCRKSCQGGQYYVLC